MHHIFFNGKSPPQLVRAVTTVVLVYMHTVSPRQYNKDSVLRKQARRQKLALEKERGENSYIDGERMSAFGTNLFTNKYTKQ